jgi:hypothetical protein
MTRMLGLTPLDVFTQKNARATQIKRERSLLSRYFKVTFTLAEWVTEPADPVEFPVIVKVPVIGAGPLEQPAITSRRTTAVTMLSRPRRPLVFGTSRSSANAKSNEVMDHVDMGRKRHGGSGRSRAPLVRDRVTGTDCAVVPSAAVIGEVTAQLVPAGAVQVNATL